MISNAQELRDLRKNLGLTQTKMAELIHVKLRMYQSYESGEHLIPIALSELIHYKTNCKCIELHTWNIEERQGMLNGLDEVMDTVKESMLKFVVKKEPHLKLVARSSGQDKQDLQEK